jgi:DNA-binding beta-propeller fold protein YncE
MDVRLSLAAATMLLMVLDGRVAARPSQVPPPAAGSASAGLLLVVSMDDARVDIVDEATWRTLASVKTGPNPHEVRISPDGRLAYVVAGRTITAVDLAARSVARSFDLGEFAAHDVRISRDGRRLWAACGAAQAVLEIDTESGAVLRRFPTARDGAWFVEVTPDEAKLYTPNMEGQSVSAIARGTAEVKVMPLDYRAYGIDITPDGRHVLISGRGVAVVDTATDTISRTIATAPPESGRIRVTPDGRRVVVAMEKSISVFDLATGRNLRETPLPAAPKVMALSGDGRRAYLTNPEDHSATVVDLDAGRVLATIKTGRKPDGIAWAPRPDARAGAR